MLSSYWEQLDTIDSGDGGGLAVVQSFLSCQKLKLALAGYQIRDLTARVALKAPEDAVTLRAAAAFRRR